MIILIIFVSLIAMIWSDWLEGRREGPRPTRTKLVYGLMLAAILYHTAASSNWMEWPTFFSTEKAIFGPAANMLDQWFGTKG